MSNDLMVKTLVWIICAGFFAIIVLSVTNGTN